MNINYSAPAVSQHEITVAASTDAVWNLLSNIDRWSDWNAAIAKSKLNGPLEPGSNFVWKSKGVSITSTLQEVEPMRRLSWTGRAIGTRAIHCWTLHPVDGGVTIATAESMEGWLITLLRKTMQRTLDTTLQSWLEQLSDAATRSK
jgi:hypothetical protein